MAATLYHLLPSKEWTICVEKDRAYYPPTFEMDGFIHLTANPSFLLQVANHFYREVDGAFVVLQLAPDKLKGTVKYEPAAAVGDKQTKKDGYKTEKGRKESDEILFPHLYGSGIEKEAVQRVLSVTRDDEGRFLSIESL